MWCEAIPHGDDALPGPVRDVVSAEEASENVRQVMGYEGEHRTRNRRENIVLETHKGTVTTWNRKRA